MLILFVSMMAMCLLLLTSLPVLRTIRLKEQKLQLRLDRSVRRDVSLLDRPSPTHPLICIPNAHSLINPCSDAGVITLSKIRMLMLNEYRTDKDSTTKK